MNATEISWPPRRKALQGCALGTGIPIHEQEHARGVIESWLRDYNEVRPHSSLKGRASKEYAEAVAALY